MMSEPKQSTPPGGTLHIPPYQADDRGIVSELHARFGADAFTGHAGEVRVSSNLIAADLDGDLRADFEIRMYGFPTLDRHDFIL